MQTWTMLAQKGGVGKSILAIGLAVETAAKRGPACIADIDPQGTTITWSDQRRKHETDPVVTAPQPNRLSWVQAECKSAQVMRLIIDTPAGSTAGPLEAAKLADLIIIPCPPTGPDLYAMQMTAQLVQIVNRPAIFVLNRGPSANTRNVDSRNFLTILGGKYGIEVCPVEVMQRMAHVKAYEAGKTAREFEPRSKAAQEMEALEDWITKNYG